MAKQPQDQKKPTLKDEIESQPTGASRKEVDGLRQEMRQNQSATNSQLDTLGKSFTDAISQMGTTLATAMKPQPQDPLDALDDLDDDEPLTAATVKKVVGQALRSQRAAPSPANSQQPNVSREDINQIVTDAVGSALGQREAKDAGQRFDTQLVEIYPAAQDDETFSRMVALAKTDVSTKHPWATEEDQTSLIKQRVMEMAHELSRTDPKQESANGQQPANQPANASQPGTTQITEGSARSLQQPPSNPSEGDNLDAEEDRLLGELAQAQGIETAQV